LIRSDGSDDREQRPSNDLPVTAPSIEEQIRAAALAWIQEVTLGGTLPITREQLANYFVVAG